MNSWPHLVGKNIEEAKKEILASNPNLDVIVIPQGTPVTQDFRPHRVRVFVDPQTMSIVQSTPFTG